MYKFFFIAQKFSKNILKNTATLLLPYPHLIVTLLLPYCPPYTNLIAHLIQTLLVSIFKAYTNLIAGREKIDVPCGYTFFSDTPQKTFAEKTTRGAPVTGCPYVG